jgi:hypothetical protein
MPSSAGFGILTTRSFAKLGDLFGELVTFTQPALDCFHLLTKINRWDRCQRAPVR